jgi:phospho-N-acetylmuramoyl-pentapeptide-transferase
VSHALIVGSVTFMLAFVCGYPLIRILNSLRVGKEIRSDGPGTHLDKTGTPTMGGILIWASVFVATALFNVVNNPSILVPLGVIAATGLVGMVDDMQTLVRRPNGGMTVRVKMAGLTVIAIGAAIAIQLFLQIDFLYIPTIRVPIEIGWFAIPLAVLALIGTANAVNLTDGLDSLAGVCSAVAFTCYGIIAHLQGQAPLATFCFTVVGALLAFLWFNAYPAHLFMGDTGALSLGAALATVAVMTGHILLLPVIGIVFVLEALSVMAQVSYFKISGGRRLLRMSPLHHHFELTGWSETQVAQRFWLVSMLSGMFGIALALI